MNRTQRVLNWIIAHDRFLLWSMIGAYILVFSIACLLKYRLFLYDGMDLAYFGQVFWNSLHGNLFAQSIHPHLSLGDHAELIILPLLIPYAIWQDPRWLLILQTIVLALCAWPIFLLAKYRLATSSIPPRYHLDTTSIPPRPPLGLVLAAFWLIGPIVQNINLFEFHILPFAIFPLLLALIAFEVKNKKWFLILAVIALLVREDVALVIATFGLLALVEKKPLWWRIVPAALGLVWFFVAMTLIAHFAPDGGYKFTIYYSWLGATPAAMALTALTKPWIVFGHIFTLANFEMILGLLMVVAFLPLLAPRRLLLIIGPLAIILLGAPGGGEIILDTHYASLFLPALFAASIDALPRLPNLASRLKRTLPDAAAIIVLIMFLCVLAAAYAFGPLPKFATLVKPNALTSDRAAAAQKIVAQIPRDESVAASYRLLPNLANRDELYSLHYQFLGVTQFAERPYALPDSVRYVAWDTGDALTYTAGILKTGWAAPQYATGFDRLRLLTNDAFAMSVGPLVLFDRTKISTEIFTDDYATALVRRDLPPNLRLESIAADIVAVDGVPQLRLRAAWSASGPQAKDLLLKIELIDSSGSRHDLGDFPLGWGLFSTSELRLMTSSGTLHLPLARLPAGQYNPVITLWREDATLTLDQLRSTQRAINYRAQVGTVLLPVISIVEAMR